MKIIKNITLLGLGCAGIMAMAADKAPPSKWTFFDELATTLGAGDKMPDPNPKVMGELYSSFSYKVDANNSVGLETYNGINYMNVAGGAGFQHKYIRFYLDQSNTFSLPGWKTSVRWRWYAPTNPSVQQAGGWGKLAAIPQITKDWGSFSFLARDLIQFQVTNQSYQRYTIKGAAPKGVDLFVNALEVIPDYKFTKLLDLSWDLILASVYTGKAPGNVAAYFSSDLYHELMLSYDTKKLTHEVLDYVGLSVDHDSPMGGGFKIISRAAHYNFKIGREFK